MNICIFSPHEDRHDFTNRNLNYAKYLTKHGIETTIYVSNFNYRNKNQKKLKNIFYEIEYYKKIRIVRLYSTRFFSNGFDRILSYLIFFFNSIIYFFFLEKKNFKFIIGESVPPLIGLSAFFCCLKNKSNFIYQIRDPWPICLYYSGLLKKKSLTYLILEFINKFLINKSKFIISTLPNLKNYYKKKYKYKNKVYYLPNGSDIFAINKIIGRKKIKFSNKSSKLIYAGGFSPSHQVLNYFKAIRYIQSKFSHLNIYYTFIGNGIELNKCKNFVQQNNLKKIKFLNTVKKSKIYKILLKNNLGICTISKDKNEIFGYNLNKIYDYVVCGLPVILTNNYYKNKTIEKNNFGYNCSPIYTHIAKNIIKFHLLSKKNKNIFSLNAKNFCNENYNVKNLAYQLSDILLKNNNHYV